MAKTTKKTAKKPAKTVKKPTRKVKTEVKTSSGKGKSTKYKPRSAFSVASGAAGKKKAKEIFEKKKADMGNMKNWPGWPTDCVIDKRHVSWLPHDWYPALKLTEPVQGRPGGGGLLLPCYVGPAPVRKRFFHKVDVEKFLQRTLTSGERGKKERQVGEHLQDKFPPESYIQREGVRCGTDYIDARCDAAHGRTVADVIANMKYKHSNGQVKAYGISDLKYDISGKRLTLSKTKPGKVPVVTGGAKEGGRKRSASSSKAAVPRKAPARGSRSSSARPASQPRRALVRKDSDGDSSPAEVAPAPSSGASSSSQPSAGELPRFRQLLFDPWLKKAASGREGEVAITALIGLGKAHKLDDIMLNNLPTILRQEPSERTDFAKFVLKAFAAELDRLASVDVS
eukprot:TRINITY_DN62712_c0_g1_i1.p1 TRINITY_DN62712_c0_g1~~TRINITY_DN62712_c0_g1_i1.p1  ORF type:complete len:418 (-),score=85.69 TRINITY_DN62712_c0_g1_i1:44-1234(-)